MTKEELNTKFRKAAQDGDTSLVKSLLSEDSESDINVNGADSSGSTAIHLASQNNHIKVIEELYLYKAQLDQQDKAGNTALHIAMQYERLEAAELLIESGVNLMIPDKKGKTALDLAKEEHKEFYDKIIKILVKSISQNDLDIKNIPEPHDQAIKNSVRTLLPHTERITGARIDASSNECGRSI